MRILHYVTGFSPLSETFVYDLIVGLESRGLTENYIACRKRSLATERPFKNTFILKNKSFIKKLKFKLIDPKHYLLQEEDELKKLLNEFKPDVIHAHFGIAGIRINNFLQRNKDKLPLIVSVHGSDILSNPHKQAGYKNELLKWNDSRPLVTTPSSFLKKECVALGIEASILKVMHNTFNKSFLNATQARAWNGPEPLKIIIVGRLVPMKGHLVALEALSKLRGSFSNFKLDIYGEGRERENIAEYIKTHGLKSHVELKGAISHKELPETLSNYHVSITPSIRSSDGQEESFCISLIEASMCGLYCIASDAGGPNEVLGSLEEYKYHQYESDELLALLQQLIHNPEIFKAKVQTLKTFVETTYHPDTYFKRYLDLYSSTSQA